jgi:glucose-6-phosphate-specific signal transduction histidine kinase
MRAHVDALVALLLTAAYLGEVYLADTNVAGEPFVAGLDVSETVAVAAGAAFLLSLALRSRMPVVPLALAIVAATLIGRGQVDAVTTLLLGLVLAAYSVGAWSGGRAAVIGALGVGALTGLLVLRGGSEPVEAREVAGPVLVLWGPWLIGLAVRRLRVARRDDRVGRARGWTWSGDGMAPDSAGRDDTVRELREVIERAMSTIILRAREARRTLDRDPRAAHEALVVVEAAGTEALEETQRLTGLLLAPDGTPLPEAGPGLGDLDYLIEEVIKAGLPVDLQVSGRPVPLTSDLDAVAYRVVHESLMATLGGATDASARVLVRFEPDALEIEVSDDGIATGDASQQTVGLEAVRKEVASLGGTLEAGPRDQRGYWVTAELPYEPDWS